MKVVPIAKYLIHEQMTVRNSVLAFHGPWAHICCCPAVNMKKFEIASSSVGAASHLLWNISVCAILLWNVIYDNLFQNIILRIVRC